MNQKEQITKSPWILCQSKSIPGKFYYFNVLTGVQAWCEDYEKVKNAQKAQKMYEASQYTSNTYKSHLTPGPYETPSYLRSPIFPHSPPRHVPNTKTFKRHETPIDIEASTSYAQPIARDNTQITTLNSTYDKTHPPKASLRRPQSNDMSTGFAERSGCRSNVQGLRRHSTALSDLTYLEDTDRQEIDDNDTHKFHNEDETSCYETIPNIHTKEINKENTKRDNYTLKITVDNRTKPQHQKVEIENSGREVKDNSINFNNQEIHVPPYYKSSPLFGQRIFQPEPAGNIIWAPIPIPVQTMYVQESQPNIKPVVEASGIPLSQRFANAARNNIILSRDEVFRKQNNPECSLVTEESDGRPDIRHKRSRFKSESDKDDYFTKSSFLENLSTSEKRDSENVVGIANLGNDDLRYVILSKKKRKNDLQEPCSYEGKKIKTYKDDEPVENKSKKKVSFLLDCDDNYEDSLDYEEENIQDEAEDTSPALQAAVWYVVVDGNTLTDEFEEIDKFIQSDGDCRLLITRRLKADVEAMCFGDCRGQKSVIFARKITRLLMSPPPHYLCLDDVNNISKVNDSADVITCCIQLLRNGHVVILVTNDAKLQLEAKIFNIKCLKTCELPSYFSTPKPEVTFDLKKLDKSVSNELGGSFDCDDNYIPLYTLNSKHNLSLAETNDQYNKAKVTKVDANTSPVNVFMNHDNTHKDTQTDFVKELSKDGGRVKKTDSIFDITIEKDKNQEDYNKNALQNSISPFEIKRTISNEFNNANNQNFKETHVEFRPIFERHRRSIFEMEEDDRNKISNFVENENLSFAPQITEPKDNPPQFIKDNRFENDCMLKYYLQQFDVKNDLMHLRIRNRFEEWVCSFEQIVEDALTQVLGKHKVFIGNTTQQEILKELMLKVEELYFKKDELKFVTNKLFSLYESAGDGKGKLNPFMKPDDFIQLFGCGVIFIQELKQTNPSYQELLDADTALQDMLARLENPHEDVASLSETTTLDQNRMDVDIKEKPRQNFVKKRSDIIKYLKAHFEAWKYYTEDSETNDTAKSEVKIFRTIGRNLGLLKLDNKSITIKDTAQLTGNTDAVKEQSVAMPKNSSNKEKEVYDLDALDYDKSCSNLTALSSESNLNQNEGKNSDISIETTSFVYDIKTGKPKKVERTANVNITSNVKVVKNDSEDDSGIGNDSIQAHLLVKMFLSQISSSLKAIHGFIEVSIAQLKEDDIEEENVSLLRNTASKTHDSLTCIIDRLTIIIQRETNERTSLKEVLLKAGLEASTDKKITRYRQVVTKCLEQARIMKSALKNLLQVTEDDCQLSVSKDSVDSNLRYYNIFE